MKHINGISDALPINSPTARARAIFRSELALPADAAQ